MQSNAVLRKRAFKLFWRHRGLLLPIYLLVEIGRFVLIVVQNYVISVAVLQTIFSFMFTIVLPVINILGLYHMLLHLYRDNSARWPMIFDFLKSPQQLPRVFAAGMIAQPLPFLILIATLFGVPHFSTLEQFILSTVLVIVVSLIVLWITFRLFMFPYLFITNPQENILAHVKTSFRTMKGQVGRLIGFGITVHWWAFLLFIGFVSLLTKIPLPAGGQAGVKLGQMYTQAVVTLLFALVNPYLNLAMMGYAIELLPSAQDRRKARRNKVHKDGNR